MRRIILFIVGVSFMTGMFAQSELTLPESENDTIASAPILFTPESAAAYLGDLMETASLWSENGSGMKYSLERLLSYAKEPIDSVKQRLSGFPFDSISFTEVAFPKADTIEFNWLNDSTFIFSSTEMKRNPLIVEEIIESPELHLDFLFTDSLPDTSQLLDSIFQETDTIIHVYIDSLNLDSMMVQLYKVTDHEISPAIPIPADMSYLTFLSDSAGVIFSDTTWAKVANEESPFYILPNERVTDSVKFAIGEILRYAENRDSVELLIGDINGHKTPLWIGSGSEDLYRIWVKNFRNDSITIWMGNPSRNNLSLYLEDEVNINRMTKRVVEDVPFTLAIPETGLAAIKPIKQVPIYWEYDLATSFSFSQSFLSEYWAKGGQSSISTLLDIIGEAKYNDTKKKQKWISSGRIKYGSILLFSGDNSGLRTNADIFEINSQYNKVIKGKFDFSTVFYMKNQIAGGFKYTEDTVVQVSKFLNPGTFTIGAGVEYKPWKHTVINFSPLSYKNTFVLDTVQIDQTLHGIDADKRTKQEMGGQLVMKNKLKIMKGLEIDNSLRMFASYTARPMNVDFDWEINLKKQITWFFTVSANLHLIYDKDILFSIKDDMGVQLLNDDGSKRKEPKLQFREFVGLSVAFKF
jgi:hypothetical protein